MFIMLSCCHSISVCTIFHYFVIPYSRRLFCWNFPVLQTVKSLHLKDMDVVVEPGIGWMELNDYLQPYGLFFPLDPGTF